MDICIVTFNRLEYLKKCIWSIIASTPGRYTINVIDDMSDDGTQGWLLEMRERGLIHQVILNESKGNTADNFNRIIENTSSGWFVMACDDMYFHRGWLEECERIKKEYDDCGIVSFFNYSRWSIDGNVEHIDYRTIKAERTGLGAAMVERNLFNAAGGFHLPPTRVMGFFASKFCWKAMSVKKRRNRLYAPKPYYATHMDEKQCKLREYYSEYEDFRSREKNPNKYK